MFLKNTVKASFVWIKITKQWILLTDEYVIKTFNVFKITN